MNRHPLRLHKIFLYIKSETFQRMTENMIGVSNNLTDEFQGNCVTPIPTFNTYHFNNESEFLCRVMKIYLDFSISAACTPTLTEIEEIKEIE